MTTAVYFYVLVFTYGNQALTYETYTTKTLPLHNRNSIFARGILGEFGRLIP